MENIENQIIKPWNVGSQPCGKFLVIIFLTEILKIMYCLLHNLYNMDTSLIWILSYVPLVSVLERFSSSSCIAAFIQVPLPVLNL